MSDAATLATLDPADLFPAVRNAAADLVEQMQKLRAVQPEASLQLWAEYIATVQEVVHFLNNPLAPVSARRLLTTTKQRREFGRLLRDKRNAVGFSRRQLARKASLSDSTIKFIETAHHPPSRATLIRLFNVAELKLCWADLPGQPAPPRTTAIELSTNYLAPLVEARDSVLMVLDQLDFDELGDAVYVRRVVGKAHNSSGPMETVVEPSHELPSPQSLLAGIDLIPRRR